MMDESLALGTRLESTPALASFHSAPSKPERVFSEDMGCSFKGCYSTVEDFGLLYEFDVPQQTIAGVQSIDRYDQAPKDRPSHPTGWPEVIRPWHVVPYLRSIFIAQMNIFCSPSNDSRLWSERRSGHSQMLSQTIEVYLCKCLVA